MEMSNENNKINDYNELIKMKEKFDKMKENMKKAQKKYVNKNRHNINEIQKAYYNRKKDDIFFKSKKSEYNRKYRLKKKESDVLDIV